MPYLSIGLGYDYATPRAKLLPKICLYNFLMCFGLLKIAECNEKRIEIKRTIFGPLYIT